MRRLIAAVCLAVLTGNAAAADSATSGASDDGECCSRNYEGLANEACDPGGCSMA
jgi:hypothetical protein